MKISSTRKKLPLSKTCIPESCIPPVTPKQTPYPTFRQLRMRLPMFSFFLQSFYASRKLSSQHVLRTYFGTRSSLFTLFIFITKHILSPCYMCVSVHVLDNFHAQFVRMMNEWKFPSNQQRASVTQFESAKTQTHRSFRMPHSVWREMVAFAVRETRLVFHELSIRTVAIFPKHICKRCVFRVHLKRLVPAQMWLTFGERCGRLLSRWLF